MRSLFGSLLITLAVTAVAAPVIENGDRPLNGRETLHLKEVWRIGGDDDEHLLGLIGKAVADAQGNVYLLDSQLIEVQVFAPDGAYLTTLGREGDGPGELRRPRDLILLPDGTVGLVEGFPGRIVKIDMDGIPAGVMHPGGDPTEGGHFAITKAEAAGPHLVMGAADITRGEGRRISRNAIAGFSRAGERLVEYLVVTNIREAASTVRAEIDRFVPSAWSLGPDGRVWIPPHRNEYRIDVYRPDGKLERSITRDYESYRRTQDEMETVKRFMTPWGGRNRGRFEVRVEETERDIMVTRVDERGRLWVLSSRGAHPVEDGVHSVWDVFDADGRFDRQVAIACEGRAYDDGLQFAGNGIVIVVKGSMAAREALRGRAGGDEDDDEDVGALEVICYRIEGI